MTVTCQVEDFVAALPEIMPLIDPHWAEVGSFRDEFTREIDYSAYAKMAAEGRLLTVTARDEGVMIGYFIGVTGLDLHRVTKSEPPQRVRVLSALVYFMLPERRGHARALIGEIERQSSDRGILIVNIRVKPGLNAADAFFDRLGYGVMEITRTKLIGHDANARSKMA